MCKFLCLVLRPARRIDIIEFDDWFDRQSERPAAIHWWRRRENPMSCAPPQSGAFIDYAPPLLAFFSHQPEFANGPLRFTNAHTTKTCCEVHVVNVFESSHQTLTRSDLC